MAYYQGARKKKKARIICLTPCVCKTPLGKKVVPVPYMISANLEDSVNLSQKCNMNGDPVFTMDSRVTCCTGNEAGTAGGVVSGVNTGWCRPKTHTSMMRIEGAFVVRDGDEFEMNCAGPDGASNTIGQLYFETTQEEMPEFVMPLEAPDYITDTHQPFEIDWDDATRYASAIPQIPDGVVPANQPGTFQPTPTPKSPPSSEPPMEANDNEPQKRILSRKTKSLLIKGGKGLLKLKNIGWGLLFYAPDAGLTPEEEQEMLRKYREQANADDNAKQGLNVTTENVRIKKNANDESKDKCDQLYGRMNALASTKSKFQEGPGQGTAGLYRRIKQMVKNKKDLTASHWQPLDEGLRGLENAMNDFYEGNCNRFGYDDEALKEFKRRRQQLRDLIEELKKLHSRRGSNEWQKFAEEFNKIWRDMTR